MAQACIYLDEETMGLARKQADERGISLSKHFQDLIRAEESNISWPDTFFQTFGSLKNSDFCAPPRPDWSREISRITANNNE